MELISSFKVYQISRTSHLTHKCNPKRIPSVGDKSLHLVWHHYKPLVTPFLSLTQVIDTPIMPLNSLPLPQIAPRQLPSKCNPGVSNNPNRHTSNHQSGIKAIKPWFRGDKISIPSLRKFNDTINCAENNGDVGEDDGGDEEFEFGGFGEGGGDSGEAGVAAGRGREG